MSKDVMTIVKYMGDSFITDRGISILKINIIGSPRVGSKLLPRNDDPLDKAYIAINTSDKQCGHCPSR